MLIAISLFTIAALLIILIILLAVTSYRSRKIIQLIQKDVHDVSQEAMRILNTVNDFISTDLHFVSKEVKDLINNINGLSSDVKNKINSFNFLFRPLSFLNSRLGSGLSNNNSFSHRGDAIPRILKWIASSIFLIKTTKEFIKHGK